MLQRFLSGRGYFLVVVDQRIVDVDGYELVHKRHSLHFSLLRPIVPSIPERGQNGYNGVERKTVPVWCNDYREAADPRAAERGT
ncbi:hypothetical protein D3C73_1349190 [compost metagenome]